MSLLIMIPENMQTINVVEQTDLNKPAGREIYPVPFSAFSAEDQVKITEVFALISAKAKE